MSSWAAYTERARLKVDETVLVNGATGTAGRLAVQIAKYLGARKVIATGRNADALRSVAGLGADVTILADRGRCDFEDRFKAQFAQGVDVVIDYLWGEAPNAADRWGQGRTGRRPDPLCPGRYCERRRTSPCRARCCDPPPIELMGSGIGSILSTARRRHRRPAAARPFPAGFKIAANPVPLSQVEQAWPSARQHPAHRLHH